MVWLESAPPAGHLNFDVLWHTRDFVFFHDFLHKNSLPLLFFQPSA